MKLRIALWLSCLEDYLAKLEPAAEVEAEAAAVELTVVWSIVLS